MVRVTVDTLCQAGHKKMRLGGKFFRNWFGYCFLTVREQFGNSPDDTSTSFWPEGSDS